MGDVTQLLGRALRIQEGVASQRLASADTLVDLAQARNRLDGPAAAEPLVRRALAIQRELLAPGHRTLVPALTALGELTFERGTVAEARELLLEAVGIARNKLPEHHSQRTRAEAALRKALG